MTSNNFVLKIKKLNSKMKKSENTWYLKKFGKFLVDGNKIRLYCHVST